LDITTYVGCVSVISSCKDCCWSISSKFVLLWNTSRRMSKFVTKGTLCSAHFSFTSNFEKRRLPLWKVGYRRENKWHQQALLLRNQFMYRLYLMLKTHSSVSGYSFDKDVFGKTLAYNLFLMESTKPSASLFVNGVQIYFGAQRRNFLKCSWRIAVRNTERNFLFVFNIVKPFAWPNLMSSNDDLKFQKCLWFCPRSLWLVPWTILIFIWTFQKCKGQNEMLYCIPYAGPHDW